MSPDNGQLSPAASNRRIVNRTVDGAVPIRRAISRVGIPADFNLITSRTWRIANLSVGIQVPLRKAERRDRIGARRGLVTPGDIIPEWWARSSRNGGRHQIGTVGEIIPEWWATSSGISKRWGSEVSGGPVGRIAQPAPAIEIAANFVDGGVVSVVLQLE
jgi:hypothetical protein